MPTITKAAIEWMQDRLESLEEENAQLEEELLDAIEEIDSLRVELMRRVADPSL